MNFDNPTQVHIGMSGHFFGRQYRVVGRALLGELEYGRMYYWNEYYLETDGKELETLVYEQTNLGGEWRWFTMFDPDTSMDATEAGKKREGETLQLDGVSARITLVRESQVCYTEGRTPEGVKPGSRANYFNAMAGPKLIVVSWTGAEVEFFRGTNLSVSAVASGFNLRTADLVNFNVIGGNGMAPLVKVGVGLAVVVVALVVFFSVTSSPATSPASAVVRYDVPAPALKAGDSGTLNGVNYRVDGHAAVEIAEMGRLTTRQEYLLHDGNGNDALLVYGWNPGAHDWLLFTPLPTTGSVLTPLQAGKVKLGQSVTMDGVTAQVDRLFCSTVIRSENLNEPDSHAGDVRYGFSGKAGAFYLLARWSDHGIMFRKGTSLNENELFSAFPSVKVK